MSRSWSSSHSFILTCRSFLLNFIELCSVPFHSFFHTSTSLTLHTFSTVIMKNFGSIFTLLAVSACVVSGRAIASSEDSLEARAPLGTATEVFARSPEKEKAAKEAATDDAASTSATGKKSKAGKGSHASAANSTALNSTALNSTALNSTALNSTALNSTALNSTGAAVSSSTSTATPKKAKGAANPKKGSAVGSDVAGQLESELAKLGGGLGLRNLPVLEARKGKKKNSTAVASGAAAAGTGAAKKKAKAAKAKNAKGTGAAATVSASP
ncbi:hypothetical protein NA56DRAFT_85263 [Hyaloscypha hepaticicola]|uniref:Uncharacterized protein n=1 Tax=Hyaloscypha hepaticicola TaxID=2082293 RepID=A0A2J6Q9T7_9HELO|nr:hypothetical protein NA56DRAFT_85263 [Hyaloscypha hepaticicola]